MTSQPLVLDTNIVLDVFVFFDDDTRPLRSGIEAGRLLWLATQAMRDELERVLCYAQITAQLACGKLAPADVLRAFDRHSHRVEAPAKAGVTCKDPDDQKFIDLAVAHRAMLLSKDRAVLALAKRLAPLAVRASATLAVTD